VSRLNHDCAPNLGYYFDSASLTLKVYAVRDIFPGEELTISYVEFVGPGNPHLPTDKLTNVLLW
jgi:SET domain-containing protein